MRLVRVCVGGGEEFLYYYYMYCNLRDYYNCVGDRCFRVVFIVCVCVYREGVYVSVCIF